MSAVILWCAAEMGGQVARGPQGHIIGPAGDGPRNLRLMKQRETSPLQIKGAPAHPTPPHHRPPPHKRVALRVKGVLQEMNLQGRGRPLHLWALFLLYL